MVSEAANLLRLSGPPARLNILRPRDPAVTDPLASGREVILSKARSRRSTGKVPDTVACMAKHALAFLKGFKLTSCDVHAFSLGGMVAEDGRGPTLCFSADDSRWHGAPRWRRHRAPRKAKPRQTSRRSQTPGLRGPAKNLLCAN